MNDLTHEARQKLWTLIKDMRFGMLTTRHANGHLHSRPMTTQNQSIDEDDALWFFARNDSEVVADLAFDREVNVAYADPGEDCYVSVSGIAQRVDDPATKRRLWSKLNEAWFPQGVDDPALLLLKVRISHASYWDVDTNKLVQLFQMARAAITGKPPAMGEHKEVVMHRTPGGE